MGFDKSEFNRREFLQTGLMGSAMLLASRGRLSAAIGLAPSAPAYYGAFAELEPGAIHPEGWLREYLEKQAAQLGSQLPSVSWPFTRTYWAGEEQAESWWPWEQKAYWIDGATRLALVLDDQKLLDLVEQSIQYTLQHADVDGYLGPQFFKEPKGDYHRWPQTILFRGIGAASDAGKNPGALDALCKHYLGDKASYGVPYRNVTNVEDILWCYRRTGDKRLLDLAVNAWQEFLKVTASRMDLTPLRVYAATPIDAHGVSYAEAAKQPAILYLYTGDAEHLRFALAAQRRIFDHHMLVDGVPSTSEHYRTRTSLDSHETCDITDHTWSWGYMLMATGNGIWADRIERACLNAGFGAIKKDWKALQYFSCPNQFLATMNSDHNVLAHGGRMMAFQPNPGQHTACCAGDVHRLFPNYVIRMWMRDGKGGLVAMLYGPSRLKATVGAGGQQVEIVEETNYPFSEEIRFSIRASEPVEFPLSLRIPAWCKGAQLSVNEKRVAAPHIANGFVTLPRRFNPGDSVTLHLPVKPEASVWPQNGIAIERGPLVYSLAIKETWTPVVEPKYTTAKFPGWSAEPASSWNYGLAVDPARVGEQIKVEQKPMTADPWIDSPITLTVPAKKIEDWKLQENPDNPAQQFTPPLPELDSSKVANALEQIKLVPYGATHLRITIFPRV